MSGPLPSHFQSGAISSPPTRRDAIVRRPDSGALCGQVMSHQGQFNLRAATANANREEKKRWLAALMLTAAAKAAGARSRAWAEDVLVV